MMLSYTDDGAQRCFNKRPRRKAAAAQRLSGVHISQHVRTS